MSFVPESYRVQNIERQPAHAEHESDPDEKVARPFHPENVVLDPLDDHVGGAASAAAAEAADAADRGVGGELAELLLHADAELAKDLVVRDGDRDGGQQVLDQHGHRGIDEPTVEERLRINNSRQSQKYWN